MPNLHIFELIMINVQMIKSVYFQHTLVAAFIWLINQQFTIIFSLSLILEPTKAINIVINTFLHLRQLSWRCCKPLTFSNHSITLINDPLNLLIQILNFFLCHHTYRCVKWRQFVYNSKKVVIYLVPIKVTFLTNS